VDSPQSGVMMTHPALTTLSDEELLFQNTVYKFAKENIGPLVRQLDAEAKTPRTLIDQLFQVGIMGIEIPEEYGGAGSSFFYSILAIEALARVEPGIAVCVDVHNTAFITALLRWGNDEQKGRFLPKAAAGSLGAYALSEAGSGSDAFALASRAVPTDGGWLLTGRKLWITNATEADVFIVFANVKPEAGYRGITGFLVERGSPGLTIGKKEDKLGIRASSTCELLLDDCRVPAENVLGEIGKGYKVAIETLNEGRIGIGAQMTGIAQAALDHTIEYTRERKQLGKRIAEFQGVQFQIVRAATELEAARLLVYNAARLRDSGKPFISEAAMCKLFASEVAEHVTSLAINLHGAIGLMKDSPVEKLFRDCKAGQIYEGTSNIQLQTIAKMILKN